MFLVAVLIGVVEVIASWFGFIATSFLHPLLPWMLAFAGGAMLYFVVEEMIPEMQDKRISSEASAGLLFGFVVMMVLDVALAVHSKAQWPSEASIVSAPLNHRPVQKGVWGLTLKEPHPKF